MEQIQRLGGWASTKVAEGYIEASVEYKKRTGDLIVSLVSGVSNVPPATKSIKTSALAVYAGTVYSGTVHAVEAATSSVNTTPPVASQSNHLLSEVQESTVECSVASQGYFEIVGDVDDSTISDFLLDDKSTSGVLDVQSASGAHAQQFERFAKAFSFENCSVTFNCE